VQGQPVRADDDYAIDGSDVDLLPAGGSLGVWPLGRRLTAPRQDQDEDRQREQCPHATRTPRLDFAFPRARGRYPAVPTTIDYRTRSPSRCRPHSVARTALTIAASHTLERRALRLYRDIYATIDNA